MFPGIGAGAFTLIILSVFMAQLMYLKGCTLVTTRGCLQPLKRLALTIILEVSGLGDSCCYRLEAKLEKVSR